jgi:murein DD-endopeptidase MepM/ murein hydrolase activator NlpD
MPHRFTATARPLAAAAAVALLAACAGRTPPPVRPTAPRPAEPAAALTDADLTYLGNRALLMPVAGARAARVPPSYFEPRSGGRVHEAVDIMAPRGTPVVAADDGRVWKVRTNALGGLTVYATDPLERFVYYYAHLDAYRPGLFEGQPLFRGDTLGYVGTTGNAPPDAPHLHFQNLARRARRPVVGRHARRPAAVPAGGRGRARRRAPPRGCGRRGRARRSAGRPARAARRLGAADRARRLQPPSSAFRGSPRGRWPQPYP